MLPDLQLRHERLPENWIRGDLKRFLYVGGASLNLNKIKKNTVDYALLGAPLLERIPVLEAIKEQIDTNLETGGSFARVSTAIDILKNFYEFVDQHNLPIAMSTLETSFYEYAEHLFFRSRKKNPTLKNASAYHYALCLAVLFAPILGLESLGGKAEALMLQTRLRNPRRSRAATSKAAEKQNLEDTFIFGSFVVDLVGGLTNDALYGSLPIRIPIRAGLVANDEVVFRCGTLDRTDKWLDKPVKKLVDSQKRNLKKNLQTRAPVDRITTRFRWAMVNLRVAAELMVFIAQTGMDLSTASKIRRERYRYTPVEKNYQVREYKERRKGEVLFEIFQIYKPGFERHLVFVKHFYPDSKWLFPWHGRDGSTCRLEKVNSLRELVIECGIPWISPQLLKNTRVNYLLRRSGDEDHTAEQNQHDKKVMRQYYEKPSQQRAMVDATRFWNEHDPIPKSDLKASVIVSQCDGKPEAADDKPSSVVEPNCVNPSGCLWCKHLRDIDSDDYVWSLCSFRYLKTLEASMVIRSDEIPADIVITRVTEKIDWYRTSNELRAGWVNEAELKINEEHYHPTWANLIQFLE